MFSVGDTVVYGSTGVCTVMDIGVPDLPGAGRKCYILKPHYVANSKIYAPVEDNPVKMRLLLTPTEAQALIDKLPEIEAFPADQERQELYETCRGAIKSTDSMVLARLLKTLFEKKERIAGQKKIMPTLEKEYFDTAEKVLYGELAAALQIPMDRMGSYIAGRLENQGLVVAS